MSDEPYPCSECEATGRLDADGGTVPCDACDETGVTAIDCPGCLRKAVPIHETVFVAAEPNIYCEQCGDNVLARIEARRREPKGT